VIKKHLIKTFVILEMNEKHIIKKEKKKKKNLVSTTTFAIISVSILNNNFCATAFATSLDFKLLYLLKNVLFHTIQPLLQFQQQ
tara:strand:+ start:404 stop:655 length:252 start_codon:yes stop_codon:yes gene_type:complete